MRSYSIIENFTIFVQKLLYVVDCDRLFINKFLTFSPPITTDHIYEEVMKIVTNKTEEIRRFHKKPVYKEAHARTE